MTINPTYLAQKTRTCTTSICPSPKQPEKKLLANDTYPATSWQDAQRRVIHAYRQWLRSVSYERILPLDTLVADPGLRIRLLRSSKCIHSICPCPNYERKYDRNLKDTDMSTNCQWWTCYYSKATRSFRYTASLPRGLEAGGSRTGSYSLDGC